MNRFQRTREMAGFTQVELSDIIGVKHSVISRYEDESSMHKIAPPLSRIEQIAQACDVQISFLTDPQELHPLNDEQRERFREAVSSYNDGLQRLPNETKAAYGTTHPFLYMLKGRWEPTVEDVEYVEKKFGIQGKYILNEYTVNVTEAEKQLKENLGPELFEITDYFYKNGFFISLEEAKLLATEGVIVSEKDGNKNLYLDISGIEIDAILALVTLANKSKKIKKPPQAEKPETEE